MPSALARLYALAAISITPVPDPTQQVKRSAGNGTLLSHRAHAQTIGNACGTIALLHSVLNNRGALQPGACQYDTAVRYCRTAVVVANCLDTLGLLLSTALSVRCRQ